MRTEEPVDEAVLAAAEEIPIDVADRAVRFASRSSSPVIGASVWSWYRARREGAGSAQPSHGTLGEPSQAVDDCPAIVSEVGSARRGARCPAGSCPARCADAARRSDRLRSTNATNASGGQRRSSEAARISSAEGRPADRARPAARCGTPRLFTGHVGGERRHVVGAVAGDGVGRDRRGSRAAVRRRAR